jgi:phosphate:Na+ symporter
MAREHRAQIRTALAVAIDALREDDRDLAGRVIGMKEEISEGSDRLARRLAERLAAPGPNRIEIFRLESEVLEIFKRQYYFAKRIAKIVATPQETVPELEETAITV